MAQGKKLNLVITSNGENHEIHVRHPVYRLRHTIMTRCYNASTIDFKYYQGRGIKVFSEWITNPKSFFQWCFDNKWKEGMALDRINPDGDYSPENCQFLTKEQNLEKMHKQNGMIGEKACNAILTNDYVLEIRDLISLGIPCTKIAKKFNVSASTIRAIKTGQNWKHIK